MSHAVAEFHRTLGPNGVASLWRDGSAKGPPGDGPRHTNPGFELTWVREGHCSFLMPTGEVSATTGGCIVLAPDVMNRPRAAATLFQVMISAERVEQASRELEAPFPADSAWTVRAGSEVSSIAATLGRHRRHHADSHALVDALADALVLALVTKEATSPSRPIDAEIARAIDFLHSHQTESVSIARLAEATGLPRFVLMRRFKAQTGTTIGEHLTRLRLERAAHSLRTTNATVLDIALSCGFTDPSRFARAFREHFNATPSAFRSSH